MTIFSANTINAQLIADAGPNRIRCDNDSIQIGGAVAAFGGTAPYTYRWETTYVLGGGTLIFHANIFLRLFYSNRYFFFKGSNKYSKPFSFISYMVCSSSPNCLNNNCRNKPSGMVLR